MFPHFDEALKAHPVVPNACPGCSYCLVGTNFNWPDRARPRSLALRDLSAGSQTKFVIPESFFCNPLTESRSDVLQ